MEQTVSVTPSIVEGSGRDREARRWRCRMSRLRCASLDMTKAGASTIFSCTPC